MSWPRRWLPGTLVVLASLGGSAPARAQEQVVLLLVPEQQPSEGRRLVDALLPYVNDLPVRLEARSIADFSDDAARTRQALAMARNENAVMVLWAEWAGSGVLVLSMVDPARRQILVRAVTASDSGADAQLLGAAQIVRSTLRTLLQTGQLGGEDVQHIVIKEESRTAPRTEISLGYHLSLYGDAGPLLHGAELRLNGRVWRMLWVHVGTSLQAPALLQEPELDLWLRSYPLDLGLRARYQVAQVWLEAGGGGRVTWQRWSVTPRALDIRPAEEQDRLLLDALVGARMGWVPAELVAIYLGAEVALALNERRFGVRSREGDEALRPPWTLRPWLGAGLCVGLY